MSDFGQETHGFEIPQPSVEARLEALGQLEQRLVVDVQPRTPNRVVSFVRGLINPSYEPPYAGIDPMDGRTIVCSPEYRTNKHMTRSAVRSALAPDPTLPLDLRLIQQVRKKKMVLSFSSSRGTNKES